MNSLPTATTPRPIDDTEVLSQRLPERGEVAVEAPQGGIPDVGHAGFKIPAGRVDESHSRPGSQPNTVSEPSMVPDLGGQPLVKEGEPSVSRTSVAPEAPDCPLEAQCFHGRRAPYSYECGDSEGFVRQERTNRSLH